MESTQSNNSSEDAVAELLTLTCEIDKWGNKKYRNKKGDLHRIHGPALITPDGTYYWYKNDLRHREDGPAMEYTNGTVLYYITDIYLTKKDFIQWQKRNGITPIE